MHSRTLYGLRFPKWVFSLISCQDRTMHTFAPRRFAIKPICSPKLPGPSHQQGDNIRPPGFASDVSVPTDTSVPKDWKDCAPEIPVKTKITKSQNRQNPGTWYSANSLAALKFRLQITSPPDFFALRQVLCHSSRPFNL